MFGIPAPSRLGGSAGMTHQAVTSFSKVSFISFLRIYLTGLFGELFFCENL